MNGSYVVEPIGDTHIAVGYDEALTFEGQQIKPYATMYHPIFGRVDMYDLKGTKRDASGVSAYFFANGAKPHEDDQHGIKLYVSDDEHKSLIRAWAAFQRQQLAHDRQLAPPAPRMVRVQHSGKIHWGYLTSVVDLGRGHEYNPALTAALQRINIRFTQCDEEDGPLALGSVWAKNLGIAGDLHSGNLGIYKGHLVGIDFGYECVSRYEKQATPIPA